MTLQYDVSLKIMFKKVQFFQKSRNTCKAASMYRMSIHLCEVFTIKCTVGYVEKQKNKTVMYVRC